MTTPHEPTAQEGGNAYATPELTEALRSLAINDYHRESSIDRDVTKVLQLIEAEASRRERAILYDLDEIENKPWRVFRQLAKIMPEYADTYSRYEKFYAYGGGEKVMKLIEDFESKEDE